MFSIGGTEKKQLVGLAVTPNLGLEALVYDKKTDEVVKYGQKFVEYNLASKEMQDPNAFRSAISDLLDELGIIKDSANIFLVLPNVHFGFRSIDDPSFDDDAIESMILSETSESYIFKKKSRFQPGPILTLKVLGQDILHTLHSKETLLMKFKMPVWT